MSEKSKRENRFKPAMLPMARINRSRERFVERLENRTLLSGSIIQVTSTLDETAGGAPEPSSLRAAIMQANSGSGSTIEFTGLATGATIVLGADLPAITAANTTIDGTTGPNLRVTIMGGGHIGFDLQASNFSAKGLSMGDFSLAIHLDGGSSAASITNDYIGSLLNGNGGDILIDNGSTNDTVGGPNAADRNILGSNLDLLGNQPAGVTLGGYNSGTTTGDLIEGNWIGLDTTGSIAAPNYFGISMGTGASESRKIPEVRDSRQI